ncbi:ribonuclease Y [Patescibacteria group bacterium]
MFDVLKTLSGLVAAKQPKDIPSKPVTKKVAQVQQSKQPQVIDKKSTQPESKTKEVISVDVAAQIKIAEAKAKELMLEAKDQAYRLRREVEEEARKKLETVERREGAMDEKEKRLNVWEKEVGDIREELIQVRQKHIDKLEKVANISREDAKKEIIEQLRKKLAEQMAKEIKDAEDKAREEADIKAREIVVDAMKHGATEYVPEYTVSIIKIKDEDMKGRIIGKEGRNIRAFETATGVDVDLDEEGVIRLSSFDPVRREIARVALEKLLKDGRVQPGRIEELITLVKRDIERIMFEEGQKLCHSVGVYNLPTPLTALLGRFKYRYSYGQSMIAHTLEETKIGIAIAQEIGADVNIVRLGCLLHDIGKVVMDKEGNHVELGVELLKKYNIPQKVTDTVAQHHEDEPFTSIESMIVYIADAISGSRPGARYENYDEYIKRLKDLEAIAKSLKGVTEAFAFQAGRELRVAVDPGQVDDAHATIIAQEIKGEIEKKVTVPGSVKITVIRELRATEVVK